jgi:D-arginine dehydrogenase
VGFDVRVPGLFWCAGQGGYGIQSAPALARAAAALVLRQPLPPDIAAEGLDAAAVSPARFEPSPAAAASLG